MTQVRQATRRRRVQTQSARAIYDSARLVRGVWMGGGDPGIHLFAGEVVESDSPGAGRSDDVAAEPFVEVCGPRVLRKVLALDESSAQAVQLAFVAREREANEATLRFTVNDLPVLRPPSAIAAPEARQYRDLIAGGWSWSRWYYVEVPPTARPRSAGRARSSRSA